MRQPELSRKRRLVFTAIVVALLVVCLEIMLQMAYYVTAGDFLFRRVLPAIYTADPVRCYRLQSNIDYLHRTNEFSARYITNAQGFRTDRSRPAYAYDKPADVYRVFVLGPSFAFGWGADHEQIYATLIGRVPVPGKRVEVINVGIPAQGPGHQLCWLAKEGYRYRPDLIVQTVVQGGMVGECPTTLECPMVYDGRLYQSYPGLLKRISGTVNVSAIVFYGYYAYHAVRGVTVRGPAPGKELWDERSQSSAGLDAGALAQEFARYVETVARVTGAETQVVFLYIPVTFVVHSGDAPRWWHMYPGEVDPAGLRARIRAEVAAVRGRGMTIIDPVDRLVAAAGRERMFYWLDIHLTSAGNRVVADEAVAVLQPLLAGTRATAATPGGAPAPPR
jgi:hypothetical protein